MHKGLFLALFFLSFITACKFNPNYQGKGSDSIQGEWAEVPISYRDSLVQYTQHQIKFTCDSFYVNLHTHSKNNIYPDSCFNGGNWDEYAKGGYVQSHDTLYLSGVFTKANWKQKISGCYRVGQYLETLIIQKNQQDTLYLKSLSQDIPIKFSLQKRTVCEPKPLN